MALELNIKTRIQGRFKLEAINADTGDVRQLAEFDNLIVNQGLDFMGSGGPATSPNNVIYCGCVVGTGTTPPAPTDTGLQSFLAGTITTMGASSSYTGAPAWQVNCNTIYQFGVGVATGTLSEIGITAPGVGQGTGTVPTAASPIFSRALIMVAGSPGTITILSNEILQVTYTIIVNLIQTPLTGTFSLNTDGTITTVSYSVLTASAAGAPWQMTNGMSKINNNLVSGSSSSGWPSGAVLGLPNGQPSGGTSVALTASTTVTTAPYVTGNYFLSFTYTIPIAVVTSSSSFGAMVLLATGLSNSFPIQISFTPPIGKTNAQTMQIVVNLGWSN